MPHRTITCRDCAAKRRTTFKNTRYCTSCRLLRDLESIDTEEHACRANGCNNVFAPVTRRDLYCGDCAASMSSDAAMGECKYCQTEAALWRGLAICQNCLRDAGERPRVVKGLRVGQRTRRKENGWTVDMVIPPEEIEPPIFIDRPELAI